VEKMLYGFIGVSLGMKMKSFFGKG